MKKKNNQNQKCSIATEIILALVTIILVVATGWEILNYVQLKQGLTERGEYEYSDTISDDEILALERSQAQIFTTRRSEFHNSILTLLSATLLSFALDATYFSLSSKKS